MTRRDRTPRPPADLGPVARAWFTSVTREFELPPHALAVLTQAARALDRAEEARAELKRAGGLTYSDENHIVRQHPAVNIERDARGLFMRLRRELRLDDAPLPDVRAPRLGGGS